MTAVQSTGLRKLDELLNGGIPLGEITEVTGVAPSGKTSLVLRLLAEVTRAGRLAAYIDTFSSLDPEYAEQAGIALPHLLWVRCKDPETENDPDNLGERALKAADILARSGDFGVVVLDLIDPPGTGGSTERSPTGRWNFPAHAWFRLQRALKGSSTAFVVLSSRPLAGRASSVVLVMECSRSRWITAPSPLGVTGRFPSLAVGNRFHGIESRAQSIRGSAYGTIQVYCRL